MKKDIVCGMDVRDDTRYTTLHGVVSRSFCKFPLLDGLD